MLTYLDAQMILFIQELLQTLPKGLSHTKRENSKTVIPIPEDLSSWSFLVNLPMPIWQLKKISKLGNGQERKKWP